MDFEKANKRGEIAVEIFVYKGKILILSAFVVVAYLVITILVHSPRTSNPVIVSHRGAAGLAPENTIIGIQKAIEVNADYAEIDIRRTRDGAIILLHDETVDRTTNKSGELNSLSLAEIQELDAGSYFGKAFSGASIPVIEEVFSSVDLTSISLAIELKNPELYPNIEQELIDLIQEKKILKHVKIISFNYSSLTEIKNLSNEASIGLLTVYPTDIPHIQDHQIVSTYWLGILLDPTLIYRLHNRGYQVWAWTVNHPTLMKILIDLGVDGITTDRPDVAINLIRRRSP